MDPHWKRHDSSNIPTQPSPSASPKSNKPSSAQRFGNLPWVAPDVIQSQIEYLQALQMQQSLSESENYLQPNFFPFQSGPFSKSRRENTLLPRLNPLAPIGARQPNPSIPQQFSKPINESGTGTMGPAVGELTSPVMKNRAESIFSPVTESFEAFTQGMQTTPQRAGAGVSTATSHRRRRSSAGTDPFSPVSPSNPNFLTPLKPIDGNQEWQQSPLESPLSMHSLQESLHSVEPESPIFQQAPQIPLSNASQQSYINHSSDGASLPQSSFLNFNSSGKRVSVSAAAQQHKNLFLPYLPQASLPKFIGTGKLLVGTLHINRKNRSDAYVITDVLDEPIFICGSKDRNRTLEGDLVAVELLDVNEIMQTKREKEEKKIRRNLSFSGSSKYSVNSKAKMMSISTPMALGMNRGVLSFERSIEKRKNDYEVTGQSLSFVDDVSLTPDSAPKYAGHVVAVLNRPSGETCSGTLALYRPNSLALKNQSSHRRNSSTSSGETGKGPKIVWFKPSDKRIPLIAISSDQVPPTFFTNNDDFKDKVFLAGIKRWPTTSLHPFGTLYESIGTIGNPKVEYKAILHDFSCHTYDFPESLSHCVKRLPTPIPAEELQKRYNLRDKLTFMIGTRDYALHIDTGSIDGVITLGIHVADVAYYVKQDMPLDDEAANRVSEVQLLQGSVPFLPKKVSEEISLIEGHDCLTISIVVQLDLKSGAVLQCSLGPSVIRPSSFISLESAQANLQTNEALQLVDASAHVLTKLRLKTDKKLDLQSLYCFEFCDGQIPNIQNINMSIFEAFPIACSLQQIEHWVNEKVASHLMSVFPSKVILRKNQRPSDFASLVAVSELTGVNLSASSTPSEIMTEIATTKDKRTKMLLQLTLRRMCNESEYTIGTSNAKDVSHFVFSCPYYTHFCHPTRRYIDICVQRQLREAFDGRPDFSKDYRSLLSITQSCNTLSNFYRNAQEKSLHAYLCQLLHSINLRSGLVKHKAFVLAVDQEYIDIVIYEFGLERRISLDLLPLSNCDFNEQKHELYLSWRTNASFFYASSSLEIDTPCFNDFKKKFLDSNGMCKQICDMMDAQVRDLANAAESQESFYSKARGNDSTSKTAKSSSGNQDISGDGKLHSLRMKEPEVVQTIRPGQEVSVLIFADTSATYSLSLITLQSPLSS
ncbi:Ribonuclease II family protein [Schizosaccharomyces pombe]